MARHDRIERLQETMQDTDLDALWVHPAQDFRYLTGLAPIAMERLFGLVIPASGHTRLVVPLLSAEECSEIEGCEFFTWTDEQGPREAGVAALDGFSSLGMSAGTPLWAYETVRSAAPRLEVSVEPSLVSALRVVKDEDELTLMRAASKKTDGIADWIETLEPAGKTEAQVASQVVRRILELGMTPHTGAIVSTGANAAMPHYAGGDVEIASDAPLLVDFGGAVEGYWSDITRMYLPAETDDEVSAAYDVVVEASQAAFQKAGPGVTCGEVDAAARSVIANAGLGDRFIHRTGHGLGLEEHEAPFIRAGDRTELKPGNVFTIEPGVYLSGRFGLRFENVVVVSEQGVESLNESPVHHRLE
jgi:Xaa-Pro aminopeptidase